MNKRLKTLATPGIVALAMNVGAFAADPVIDEAEVKQVDLGHTEQDVVQSLGQPMTVIRVRPGVVTYVYEGMTEPGDEAAYLFVDILPNGTVDQYHIEKAE